MKGGTILKVYNEFLYDDIGNAHVRKNLYLKEIALLQKEYDETGDKSLLDKVNNLASNRQSHPYIQKLDEFLKKEAAFKEELQQKAKEFHDKFDDTVSKTMKRLLTEQFESQHRHKFYESYVELSYEAQYEFERSVIEINQYPSIIDHLNENEVALAEQLERSQTIDPVEQKKGEEALAVYISEQKKILAQGVEDLKQKRKQGIVSTKALVEGRKELKAFYKDHVQVKTFEVPDKKAKEKIKNRKFEINTISKRKENVLKANVADLRRKIPVEIEKQITKNAMVSFLLPGLGQRLNGQKAKSNLFFLVSFFIYVMAIPYALGFGNYRAKGVFSLVRLAEGGGILDKSIIFLIEGIVAVFLTIMALILLYLSYKDVKTVESNAIKGVRPNNWFETKTVLSEDGFPFMVSLPALLVTVFIVLVPITTAILLSFTNMDPYNQSKFVWNGIENYKDIITGTGIAGGPFWLIFGWTLIWTASATTLAIGLGFILALILNNERIKGKAFFRSIYILPWAVPAFITIMFFSIMFSRNGILTEFFSGIFNPGGDLLEFKNSTNLTRITLICMQGWLGSSYVFLLSTGVLQAIPGDLYEAAQIDGASMMQKLRKITIPIVLFQTAPLLVGQYTFNFNNFSIIYLFNGGGPNNPSLYGNLAGSSDLLISYIYKLTMDNDFQAIGAAITIVISLGLMLFAFIGFKNSKAFKEEKL